MATSQANLTHTQTQINFLSRVSTEEKTLSQNNNAIELLVGVKKIDQAPQSLSRYYFVLNVYLIFLRKLFRSSWRFGIVKAKNVT